MPRKVDDSSITTARSKFHLHRQTIHSTCVIFHFYIKKYKEGRKESK